jgi:5-methylcytosine-specific restriction endonuclease McrA
VFDQVRRAVGDLEAVSRALDPNCLDGRAASALVELAARGERICSAIKALGARRVEETNAWREGGHRSAAHWVAEATGETVGAAGRALETARALEHLPQTDAAFRAGQLSPTQAAEITSAAGADPAAESALLETAAGTGVKGLRDRCREVRAGAEADDAAWARRLHVERRAHSWTDPDGVYRLEARLAPDAGARFDAAWKAHIGRIFRDARRAGRREPHAAYAADALVALAGEGPCKPVEVRAVVDTAALARGHAEPRERCEIVGIGPVPVKTARALLDDASVTVMTRDGDDITAVSRPTRTIPTKLRRALETRYPTCGVPGCANDHFLEIDHVVPIEDHGATEIENLWRLCSHHHALKTYQGWKVVSVNGDRDLVPP